MQVRAGKVAVFALKLYNGNSLMHMVGLHICHTLFDRQLCVNETEVVHIKRLLEQY